ncbi:MAG: secondary thiamine-phosphate synthase enzyme YjbQ, partial [Thermodesulfovibrionales bacterium]|nr:secondary thiamine-phosphate synthase enzyme YjbQ [Thermodesulfovibrionales bacterium]
MLRYINVRSSQRSEFIDITEKINEVIKETGILSGICYVYVPHTTAAVTINEGADPSVHRDIQNALTRLVPQEMNYSHREGNADAHIKSRIIGTSQLVIIDEGRLVLGSWQAVYFCEFDGPRHRRVTLKII